MAQEEMPERERTPKRSPSNGARAAKKILHSFLRCLLTIFLVGVITGSIVICVLTVYVVTKFNGEGGLPDLGQMGGAVSSAVLVMDKQSGEYKDFQCLDGSKQVWVDYDEIPTNMKNAVIAIEDERFKDHDGVDWKRTAGAMANLVLHFSSTEYGGSTITQQLIKVVTGDNAHTAERKITEIMRAVEMENNYSKQEILSAYLNVLPLSSNVKGVGAAANFYFDKDCKDMTLAECAIVASITNNPSKYDPYRHPENVRWRQRVVLYKMYELGFITEDEYIQAYNEELHFKKSAKSMTIQDYYTDMLINQVISDLQDEYGYTKEYATNMVYYGGLKIFSCEDPELQARAEAIYADDSNFPKSVKGDKADPQAAIVVQDYKGKVVVCVGGRGEKTQSRVYNRATQSTRSPGSCIKPLTVYSQAISKNLVTYSSQVKDCYITLADGTKWPRNFGQSSPRNSGTTLLHTALQKSLNTVAARLAQQVTPKRCFEFLQDKLQFSTLVLKDGSTTDVAYAPMTLGGLTNGVLENEMAAAYAIFGNGGYYYKPYCYTKVMKGTQEILTHQDAGSHVLDTDSAYVMNRMMQEVITGSSGTAHDQQKSWSGWEVYAKTGTTQENKDSYFCGGNAYYVGASWLGYDTPKPLSTEQKKYPRALWTKVMKAILEDAPAKKFTNKGTTVEAKFCTSSGKLATSSCRRTASGVYKKSNVPGYCTSCGGGTHLPVTNNGTTTTKAPTTTAATDSAATSTTP